MKRGAAGDVARELERALDASVPDWAKKLITGSFIGESSLMRSPRRTWPSCQ